MPWREMSVSVGNGSEACVCAARGAGRGESASLKFLRVCRPPSLSGHRSPRAAGPPAMTSSVLAAHQIASSAIASANPGSASRIGHRPSRLPRPNSKVRGIKMMQDVIQPEEEQRGEGGDDDRQPQRSAPAQRETPRRAAASGAIRRSLN